MRDEGRDHHVKATFYFPEILESMTEALKAGDITILMSCSRGRVKEKLLNQIYCLIFVEKVKTN
jgi:hypothetical protein